MDRLVTIRNHFLQNRNSRPPHPEGCSEDQGEKIIRVVDPLKYYHIVLNQVKWASKIHLISETKALIKTPGLSSQHMDNYGKPNFPDVVKLATENLTTIFQSLDATNRSFIDIAEMRKNTLDFLVSTKVEVTKSVYDVSVRKAPIDIIHELHHVGKTSWTTQMSLYNGEGVFFGRIWVRDVVVDPDTRRPVKLPGWWVDKYSQFVDANLGLTIETFKRIDPSPRPFRARMFWSHTDLNGHVNFQVFYQICVDASYYFVSSNSYPTITELVLCGGIKTMECVYLGESFLGDKLDVHSCETDDGNLRFDVCRENSKTIFQAKFAYMNK